MKIVPGGYPAGPAAIATHTTPVAFGKKKADKTDAPPQPNTKTDGWLAWLSLTALPGGSW